MQGNIVASVEIECFIAQNHSMNGKESVGKRQPFSRPMGSASILAVPTACAVLGHQEADGLDEEEPNDGEAVEQQPEHLPRVLGHPVDIQLVRRPLVMVCTLHPTRANALCGSHWREGLAIQMFSCSSRLVKLAPNQGVL